MTTFPLADGAYVYRPLKKASPALRGWDVYALQTALLASGLELPQFGADGFFGTETERAARTFQDLAKLKVDGIAGIVTQHALGARIVVALEKSLDLPDRLLYGATENESGWMLGNHTEPYANKTRDLGPVQKNEPVTDATCVLWFNVKPSIRALAEFVKERHARYIAGHTIGERRAWELAVAAWNRPAWADTLARGGTVSAEQRAWVEQYVSRACAYVDWSAV